MTEPPLRDADDELWSCLPPWCERRRALSSSLPDDGVSDEGAPDELNEPSLSPRLRRRLSSSSLPDDGVPDDAPPDELNEPSLLRLADDPLLSLPAWARRRRLPLSVSLSNDRVTDDAPAELTDPSL